MDFWRKNSENRSFDPHPNPVDLAEAKELMNQQNQLETRHYRAIVRECVRESLDGVNIDSQGDEISGLGIEAASLLLASGQIPPTEWAQLMIYFHQTLLTRPMSPAKRAAHEARVEFLQGRLAQSATFTRRRFPFGR